MNGQQGSRGIVRGHGLIGKDSTSSGTNESNDFIMFFVFMMMVIAASVVFNAVAIMVTNSVAVVVAVVVAAVDVCIVDCVDIVMVVHGPCLLHKNTTTSKVFFRKMLAILQCRFGSSLFTRIAGLFNVKTRPNVSRNDLTEHELQLLLLFLLRLRLRL